MLSIKGVYDGNVIIPLMKVNKKANTPVIITFLEEEFPSVEMELIKDTQEKYRRLSESFDFGESPDEEYSEELMSTYYETFSRN